jgi:hypothetical protein
MEGVLFFGNEIRCDRLRLQHRVETRTRRRQHDERSVPDDRVDWLFDGENGSRGKNMGGPEGIWHRLTAANHPSRQLRTRFSPQVEPCEGRPLLSAIGPELGLGKVAMVGNTAIGLKRPTRTLRSPRGPAQNSLGNLAVLREAFSKPSQLGPLSFIVTGQVSGIPVELQGSLTLEVDAQRNLVASGRIAGVVAGANLGAHDYRVEGNVGTIRLDRQGRLFFEGSFRPTLDGVTGEVFQLTVQGQLTRFMISPAGRFQVAGQVRPVLNGVLLGNYGFRLSGSVAPLS